MRTSSRNEARRRASWASETLSLSLALGFVKSNRPLPGLPSNSHLVSLLSPPVQALVAFFSLPYSTSSRPQLYPLPPLKKVETQRPTNEMAPTSLTKDLKRKHGDVEATETARPPYKQRVLLLSSRGISQRQRHLMNDLTGLLPHAKKGEFALQPRRSLKKLTLDPLQTPSSTRSTSCPSSTNFATFPTATTPSSSRLVASTTTCTSGPPRLPTALPSASTFSTPTPWTSSR